MPRKSINTTIDNDKYTKIQRLALKLSAEKMDKVNANDLIEEGMDYILKKYDYKE